MRTATCLTLVAIGAILTFAVKAHPRFLNLQVAGVVIILVGVAGLLLNRSGDNWLRRRIVVRRGRGGPVVGHIDETNYPSYVHIDPEALESVQPIRGEEDPGSPPVPDASAEYDTSEFEAIRSEQAAGHDQSAGHEHAAGQDQPEHHRDERQSGEQTYEYDEYREN
jgi:hypothetical protein